MSHSCKVRVRRVTYYTPEVCPFAATGLSLRELARRSGLDVGYLSRVRSGKVVITPGQLQKIVITEDQL